MDRAMLSSNERVLRALIREYQTPSEQMILTEGATSEAVKEVAQYALAAASEYGLGAAGGALTLPAGAEGVATGPVVETVIDSVYAADSVKMALASVSDIRAMAGDYSDLIKSAYGSYDPGNWKGFYSTLRVLVKRLVSDFKSVEKGIDVIAAEIKEALETVIDAMMKPIKKAIQFVIPDATAGLAAAKAVEAALKSLTDNAYTLATSAVDKVGFLKRFVSDPTTAQEFFESVITQLVDLMRTVADKIDETSALKAFMAGGLLSVAGGPGGLLATALAKGLGPKMLRKAADSLEKYMPDMLDLIDKILRVIIPYMFSCLALFQIIMRGEYKDKSVKESRRKSRALSETNRLIQTIPNKRSPRRTPRYRT